MFIVRISLAIMLTAALVSVGLLIIDKKENKQYKMATPHSANTIEMPWGLGTETQLAESQRSSASAQH